MHTGSTDNYSLTQFASTDKPAWLVDYNEDMRKIDAGMKGNADAIETLGESVGQEGTDITELKERMATAEADIDSAQEIIGTGELETQVKNLIGAANELLGLIHDNDNDITALQQGLAGVGDAIDGVAQLAYTIANVYDSTQTYTVGSYAIYQNTLYKCITAITVGEAFNPAKWTSVKVMNEISSGGGVTAAAVSFDNTGTGLSATNAQNAIVELAPKIAPDVSVTADGVKTLGALLHELAIAVDFSKITYQSHIVMHRGQRIMNLGTQNWVLSGSDKSLSSMYTQIDTNGTLYLYSFVATTTNNSAARLTFIYANNSITSQDETSTIPTSGDTFEIYY